MSAKFFKLPESDKRRIWAAPIRQAIRCSGQAAGPAAGRWAKEKGQGRRRGVRCCSGLWSALAAMVPAGGVPVQEVNRLLKQFEQTQDMMKRMKRGGLGKMMRALGQLGRGGFPGMGSFGR